MIRVWSEGEGRGSQRAHPSACTIMLVTRVRLLGSVAGKVERAYQLDER
jgi:hypothetical protein